MTHVELRSIPVTPLERTNSITSHDAGSATKEKLVQWFYKNPGFTAIVGRPRAIEINRASTQYSKPSIRTRSSVRITVCAYFRVLSMQSGCIEALELLLLPVENYRVEKKMIEA